jgi:hypothetical protein
MKAFFISHTLDPIIYTGNTQFKILVAVAQPLCCMASRDWNELPSEGTHRYDALNMRTSLSLPLKSIGLM